MRINIARTAPTSASCYTHFSGGSGKEVYLHFCKDCGTHLFLTFQRWDETMNVFTTSFDDPEEVRFDPETLRYLFLDAAQSGTITPKGFEAFEGHCEPADGSLAVEHVFDRFEEIGVFRGSLDMPNRIDVSPATAIQIFLHEALPSGMVIAGIEAFAGHRRAPDGSINPGHVYEDHWRVGDGSGA